MQRTECSRSQRKRRWNRESPLLLLLLLPPPLLGNPVLDPCASARSKDVCIRRDVNSSSIANERERGSHEIALLKSGWRQIRICELSRARARDRSPLNRPVRVTNVGSYEACMRSIISVSGDAIVPVARLPRSTCAERAARGRSKKHTFRVTFPPPVIAPPQRRRERKIGGRGELSG